MIRITYIRFGKIRQEKFMISYEGCCEKQKNFFVEFKA